MEEYGSSNNHSNKKDNKQYYHSFAKQLSDWYCNGAIPELASQDTRFTLELQKQKLRSLGLDMQIQIGKPKESSHEIGALSYGDSVFVNSIIGGSKHLTTNIRNSQKEIYSSDSDGGLTVVMQNPKKGGVPSPDTAMCCPNCGASSTLGKLESGCEFCNTKFLMDELYPKVMHFFIQEDGKKLFDTRKIVKYVLICICLFSIIIVVSTLFKAFTGALAGAELLMNAASAIFASVILGVMFGVGAWFIVNSFASVKLMGKNARGGSKTVKSLIFCNKMRTLDPAFSTEYFRDKSMSLLKFMLFSPNPQELTICQCDSPIPDKLREIVDITYFNSGVDKYSIRDGVCDVSLTFYTDSLHYRSGKVLRESDKIRLSLRKVIKKPTDLGFSVMAVTCPSCGASFDAAKVKDCPFCGSDYPLEENEWVVTDISV
ncbi:hypothetical protein SAMN02910353_02601 [Ruminococcus sp. YRD2003]|uniref:hypothetical protein n=1 Tax=Ruminococcus sp. YRD2003 TaxID=1452313 RepID=UPI0008D4E7F7|nr:hypothetical protein SAMN02910353_02601 [Ruminococcus flavefaciens]